MGILIRYGMIQKYRNDFLKEEVFILQIHRNIGMACHAGKKHQHWSGGRGGKGTLWARAFTVVPT